MKKGQEKDWKTPQEILKKYEQYKNHTLLALSPEQIKKNGEFEIEPKYEIIEEVGRGAYGVVLAVKNTESGEMVAIKKISKAFEHRIFAKRTLRELKILRNLHHENILKLHTIVLPKSREQLQDIYLVSELVEGDLYSIIKSPQQLEEDHIKFIIYQILRGLKYMHSANILH